MWPAGRSLPTPVINASVTLIRALLLAPYTLQITRSTLHTTTIKKEHPHLKLVTPQTQTDIT